MKREALMLYLQNVRDLEVAKHRLEVLYNDEHNTYRKRVQQLPTTVSEPKHEEPNDYPGGALSAVIVLAIFALVTFSDAPALSAFCIVGLVTALIVFFIRLANYTHSVASCKEQNARAESNHQIQVAKAEQNQAQLQTLNKEWERREMGFRKEYAKVTELLKNFYNMNILPSQYRTLSSVCYIYDYMSTSQASLQDTLIHEHMENGIQRLESKLNVIIYRIENVVYETRCMRQENRQALERIIAQNSDMLGQLQRIEVNAENAATYAELASNYSKANAYFSAADYLKTK